jgi:rare lipoprotein A (RlpA)-like double-psi beta-barrel protein
MHPHAMHPNGSLARKAAAFLLTAVLTVLAFGPWPAASAESVDRRLSRARSHEEAVRDTVGSAERRLAAALREYRAIQQQLSRAAVDVVSSYQAQEFLTDELASAQETLDRRATEAYEAGPAIALEMFLGSATPADFASAQEFAARAFTVDEETVTEVTRLRAELAALTVRREARQQELAASAGRLEELAAGAMRDLHTARAEATKAGLTVRKLEREAQALREARAAADASLAGLVDSSRGKDQSELLALLGPTGGRTCEIPPGLRDTGRDLAGYSSWYGWEFAGRPTASGAIFDPRLFTLANKELPLGVFLRIRYKGKCAIALVNDRGPYGVPGRIFDVSEAVAKYLGYKGAGVGYVTTDVLVPA